jgi:hypothetical protein
LAGVSLDSLECVAASLNANIQVTLRWRGSQLDRLLDARHARLVASLPDADSRTS